MESDDPSSAEFTQKFTKLRAAVFAYAEAEESTVIPLLDQSATPEQRQDLGARYIKAEDKAPTHPHPHAADTPPGNKLLGPILAIFDQRATPSIAPKGRPSAIGQSSLGDVGRCLTREARGNTDREGTQPDQEDGAPQQQPRQASGGAVVIGGLHNRPIGAPLLSRPSLLALKDHW